MDCWINREAPTVISSFLHHSSAVSTPEVRRPSQGLLTAGIDVDRPLPRRPIDLDAFLGFRHEVLHPVKGLDHSHIYRSFLLVMYDGLKALPDRMPVDLLARKRSRIGVDVENLG